MSQSDNIKRIFITSTKGAALLNSNKNINSFEPQVQPIQQQYNIPSKPIMSPPNINKPPVTSTINNNITNFPKQIMSPSNPNKNIQFDNNDDLI